MAKRKPTATPTVPWADTEGSEVTEPGIGVGFASFEQPGQYLRGKLLRRWKSRRMRSPAVTIELTDDAGVTVVNTEDGKETVVEVSKGDKVNVSLTFDLDRKLTADLEGEEVGLFYDHDQATPKGSMRVFKVYHFGADLPF